MSKDLVRSRLSAKEHAMLFAFIVRNALNIIGKDAEAAIENGVIKYGEQRGRRMAKRVLKDGEELSLLNYLVYGEWVPYEASEMDIKFPHLVPELNMVAHKCSWYDCWNKKDMLEEGKYYCKHVDAALARGFREDLDLDLISNRTEGAEKCDFYFREEAFNEKDLEEVNRRKKILNGLAIKPWDYHIAHIFNSMKDSLIKYHGRLGEKVIEESLRDYEKEFGKETLEILMEYNNTDFESIDDYKDSKNKF